MSVQSISTPGGARHGDQVDGVVGRAAGGQQGHDHVHDRLSRK
jgi:hypothetical protein